MVFFAGANLFSRSAPAMRHFAPQAVTLEYANVCAPCPVVLHRDQEHFEVAVEHTLLRNPYPTRTGSLDNSVLVSAPERLYTVPFAPLPPPLVPRRSHIPPVAVVDATRRYIVNEMLAPRPFAPVHYQPAPDVTDAVDILNAALRYLSGLAPARPDYDSRRSSLEIVESSLPASQFHALRDEILSSPLWRGDGPFLLPAGLPKRRFLLRAVSLSGGGHSVSLESVVDYREPFETAPDPDPFEAGLNAADDGSEDTFSDSDVIIGSFEALQLSFLSDSESDGAIPEDDRDATPEMFLSVSAALDRDGFVDIVPDHLSSD